MKGNNCKTARKSKEYFVSVGKLFKSSNQHWQNKRIALTISPCLGSSWFLLRAGETNCSQREPTQARCYDAKCLTECSYLGNHRNSNKRIHQQYWKVRYQECKTPWSSFASFLCLWKASSNDDSSSSSAMFAGITEMVLHEASKNLRSTWAYARFVTRSPPSP